MAFIHRYGFLWKPPQGVLYGQVLDLQRSELLALVGQVAMENLAAMEKELFRAVRGKNTLALVHGALVPWGSELYIHELPNHQEIRALGAKIGDYLERKGVRLGFYHPEGSTRSLNYQAVEMDLLGLEDTHLHPIVVRVPPQKGGLNSRAEDRLVVERGIHKEDGFPTAFNPWLWEKSKRGGDYKDQIVRSYKSWGKVKPLFMWQNSSRVWEGGHDDSPSRHIWRVPSLPKADLDMILKSGDGLESLKKFRKDFNR